MRLQEAQKPHRMPPAAKLNRSLPLMFDCTIIHGNADNQPSVSAVLYFRYSLRAGLRLHCSRYSTYRGNRSL